MTFKHHQRKSWQANHILTNCILIRTSRHQLRPGRGYRTEKSPGFSQHLLTKHQMCVAWTSPQMRDSLMSKLIKYVAYVICFCSLTPSVNKHQPHSARARVRVSTSVTRLYLRRVAMVTSPLIYLHRNHRPRQGSRSATAVADVIIQVQHENKGLPGIARACF